MNERFFIINDMISYLSGVKYVNDLRPIEVDENK